MSNPPDEPTAEAPREQSPPDWVSLKETAVLLHVSVGTLYQWRHHRKNLRFYKIGGQLMCDRADITAYIRACAQEPAA